MVEMEKKNMTQTRNFRLGIIARSDATGLGVQSRNWVRLLNPDKVILIDSTPFNHNEQHPDWYKDYNVMPIYGFVQPNQINQVLDNIDVLLSFEIFYSYELVRAAKAKGIKTILQNNWEFTDYLQNSSLPLPDLLVNHSYWNLDEQKKRWPQISTYCATPVFVEDYDSITMQNFEKKGKRRFLHIAGRRTYEDRNGTEDLLKAVRLIPLDVDFELVIKTQTTEIGNTNDPRITIDKTAPDDEKELYRGFDGLIMPRRYGGACLPMTEALAAGLPVMMTDVDPNNKVLPKQWLVDATRKTSFMARTEIIVYESDIQELADKIEEWATDNEGEDIVRKLRAREIAEKEYSSQAISKKWALLLGKIGV